jgi:phospholipase C
MNSGTLADAWRTSRAMLAITALMQNALAPAAQAAKPGDTNTVTPIKHVIVIVGENRTFDHLFGAYQPVTGETVNNLLSQEIITAEGTPGTNYAKAHQYSADVTGHVQFELSPTAGKTLYSNLPAPLNGGPSNVCTDNGMCNYGNARSSEDGLSDNPIDYYNFLLTGGSGLTGHLPDTRITGVHNSAPFSTLPSGPFQITNGTTFTDDSYANSPVHRFYQMWQQEDCNSGYSTPANRAAAWPISSPGRKSPLAPTITAKRSPPTSAPTTRPERSPPTKALPRWRSTTCRRATLHISSTSPTTTP